MCDLYNKSSKLCKADILGSTYLCIAEKIYFLHKKNVKWNSKNKKPKRITARRLIQL